MYAEIGQQFVFSHIPEALQRVANDGFHDVCSHTQAPWSYLGIFVVIYLSNPCGLVDLAIRSS